MMVNCNLWWGCSLEFLRFLRNWKYSLIILIFRSTLVWTGVVTLDGAPAMDEIVFYEGKLSSSAMQSSQSRYEEPIGSWKYFSSRAALVPESRQRIGHAFSWNFVKCGGSGVRSADVWELMILPMGLLWNFSKWSSSLVEVLPHTR